MIRLRAATGADVPRIEAIVRDAYAHYLPRMDRPPGPMLDDYAAHVAAARVTVAEVDGEIAAILVLVPSSDHLLLDNVAVATAFQGRGLGRALIAHAEATARTCGLTEIRLYTNVVMTENIAFYAQLGFVETHRAEQAGYQRVFMRKLV